MKLDDGVLRLLKLVSREADADGWAQVSAVVWPAVERIPQDLIELRQVITGGGKARLTAGGQAIATYA